MEIVENPPESVDSVQFIETVEELEKVLEFVLPEQPPPPDLATTKKFKVTLPFNMEKLHNALSTLTDSTTTEGENKMFMARMSPDNAEAAEAELSRQIGQSDFEKVFYHTVRARVPADE